MKFDTEIKNKIIKGIDDIQIKTLNTKLKSKKANYYMQNGVGFRLFIIKESFYLLVDAHEKVEHNSYESGKLNIAINSIYLNIRGILDNLAWVLAYVLNIEKINYNIVGINNIKYLKILEDKGYKTDILKKYDGWIKELKEKRDPIAHRLPLQIPRVIITNKEDELSWKQVWANANMHFKKGNFHDGSEELQKLESIGKFYSVILQTSAEEENIITRDLSGTLLRDFESLRDCVLEVLEDIIKYA